MEYVTLNNGVKMPILGFGVYQMDDRKECEEAVFEAIQTGYRLIDTAAAYENEEAVGKAIERSNIPREELFITTKLWIQNAGYTETKMAFKKSLKRLNLDYLDLYLIHQPYGDYYGSWRAMEELYKEGKIRAIGVSNFYPDRLKDLATFNDIVPAVNQVETHPFYQRETDQQFMETIGVQMESWGPFAEGRNELFSHPVLASIGAKYNKSIAQVVLRWLIQRNIVAIPKSVKKDRIKENFNIFDFNLSVADSVAIRELDLNYSQFFKHDDPAVIAQIGKIKFNID